MNQPVAPVPSWKHRARRTVVGLWGVARQHPALVGLALATWIAILAQSFLGISPKELKPNADAFYTKEDDGLTKPWYGRVWLNPPYAQPLIAHFAEAVAGKFSSGEFEQAVVLVNNATDTKWLQSMMRVCAAVCFPEGRIRFMNQKGDPVGAPLQGQVFLYFGEDVESFLDEFASFGVVMRR